MNPVLVDSIRRRMREQTTEQLLELWVTNDRVTWSPEAFEAVKSLLAEQGLKELPPQNDPAPVAQTHSPIDDPVARYWLGWLLPVLWICCVVSAASVPRLVGVLWAMLVGGRRGIVVDDLWRAIGTLSFWLGMIDLGLPLVLGVGAIGALRLKQWSRPLLLSYAGVTVVNTLAFFVGYLWRLRNAGLQMWLLTGSETLNTTMKGIVLPLILWLLLRRPEIRTLFMPAGVGSAFQPLHGGNVVSNPTAA
jgi:hypothetical protein